MKIKSLAAESRIIRQEERRHPGDSAMRRSLYLHRISVVRVEARASLLLYAFAKWQHARSKGFPADRWAYRMIEANADIHCPDRSAALRKAAEMGARFGIETAGMEVWLQ